MTLDEFVKLTHQELDEFAVKWKAAREGEPIGDTPATDAYPLEMNEGEWHEMLLAYWASGCKV